MADGNTLALEQNSAARLLGPDNNEIGSGWFAADENGKLELSIRLNTGLRVLKLGTFKISGDTLTIKSNDYLANEKTAEVLSMPEKTTATLARMK